MKKERKKREKRESVFILFPSVLSKTGEEQLEANFQHNHYHVAEPLSDLAYYHYIARRTPVPILIKFVRPNYQVREGERK
jgi:hypothetical protein